MTINDENGHEKLLGDLAEGYKAILIVNVASKCGLTDRDYKDLVEIYAKYHARGL